MHRRHSYLTIIFVVGCSLSEIQALDQKTIDARVARLRQMSEVDRGRFDRNLQDFEKLSEADKHKYRLLHESLVKDSSQGGGLTRLLQTYSAWVQTLTPTQRDELQKETVPSQKMALIRRFKEEQDELNDSHDHPQTDANAEEATQQVNSPIRKEAFPLKDVRAVMAVVVSRLPQESVKPEFSEPRVSDYAPIFQASVVASGAPYRDWPGETLLKDMTAALSKESLSLVNRADYKSRREATLRFLLMGIMKQARDSVRPPTDSEKLQILLEGHNQDERDRIINLPADKMNALLVKRVMEAKGGDALEAFRKLPEFNRQIDDLFTRFEVTPPQKFLLRGKKGAELRGDGKRPVPNRTNRNPGENN